MARHPAARFEHLLHIGNRFLEEFRSDLDRATLDGSDTPPRLRMVHERAGHASPEYRTLSIPVPDAASGASPEHLSAVIAHYSRGRAPDALLLAMELVGLGAAGEPQPLLIAEARSRDGVRLFWMQSYSVRGGRAVWDEPEEDGWQDPGEEEMILDESFAVAARSG
ncbi:MAG: hypothetical protein M3409_08505 [Gemmatimonadota bacterium]|nr:hypothetical protein [Gemmatimonadota bacterium]